MKGIAAFDRGASYGFGGHIAGDIRSSLYNTEHRPQVIDYIGGMGGRDVTVDDIKEMLISTVKYVESGEPAPEEIWHDLLE